MRIAYLDMFAGISGDMTLGALIDAGADISQLREMLTKLPVHGYDIQTSRRSCHGISATDVLVNTHHHDHDNDHGHSHEHAHGRSYTEIVRMIESADIPDRAQQRAIAIFTRLGNAEAKIHGKSIDEIHFHEVGAVDAIVDIVGTCICLELLKIDKILASPVPTFHGTVTCQHGVLPLPAPATLEILQGVPWRKMDIEGELVTPTGAAIAAELAESFGAMPPMTVDAIGYGAGKYDLGLPNVLRIAIGNETNQLEAPAASVAVVETNIDDMSPQLVEPAMEKLFEAGALDAYVQPITMKKGRPALLMTVICRPENVSPLSDVLFAETTTIGVRVDYRERVCLEREIVELSTRFGRIRMKIARRQGRVLNAQPEYEDCKRAAAEHMTSVKAVRDAAIAQWTVDN